MMSKDEDLDWDRLADPRIITVRQMVGLIAIIEIIIQTFALIIAPTAWWTWQLLGFITATNLGAVMLAIIAQKTANDIGDTYKKAFTPSFYRTIALFAKFEHYFEEEAKAQDREINEEVDDMAPKLYGLLRKYLDTKALDAQISPPEVDVLPIDEDIGDDALFRNT